MDTTKPIDWAARKDRAMAHTKRLAEEWERARKKKGMPRWVAYCYDAPIPRAPGAGGETSR